MLRWSIVAIILLNALSASTGDKTKPNTLTPKEIADGWLSLFDGETTFGWKVDGATNVVDGVLVAGGDRDTVAQLSTRLHNFEFSMEYRTQGGNVWRHLLHERGSFSTGQLPAEEWHKFELSLAFDAATGKFEERVVYTLPSGEQIKRARQDSGLPGQFALGFYVASQARLQMKNVKLKPLALKSIFNGKDLTGWKVFANKKSKFTVNDKGELNIKDGPGDLQTEGKYGDFILQLECISNGKHLNSGVFFRCRPNEYQNGYEAQIRNQFTAQPTQEYTIEEYDPVTHKLIGKNKIKSTAFDYGTGAIYRRMPARKEVAKDNEWFAMTIVAHGRHIATWVNGIQVADWTDNRPPSDNARTGCRLEAGHISLQGHDPTTDLSFRNFRIAELPPVNKK